MERHVRQLHSGDALPVLAARDADPVAEGCVGGPFACKDALWVGEVGFESQQRWKISVAALSQRKRANTRYYV